MTQPATNEPADLVPDSPTAPETPSELHLKIAFPPLNIFEARKTGPQIRVPNDKRFDYAELRDIQTVVAWTRQAAGSAAIQVVQFASARQAEQVAAAIDSAVSALARAYDQATPQMIRGAIEEYDAQVRARAWYRRLWRAAARLFTRSSEASAAPAPPVKTP